MPAQELGKSGGTHYPWEEVVRKGWEKALSTPTAHICGKELTLCGTEDLKETGKLKGEGGRESGEVNHSGHSKGVQGTEV